MTSTDNVVTVEMFNAGIEGLKSEIRRGKDELRTEIRLNARDTEHLQTLIYWVFALMAIFVAFVGFLITLAPTILEFYKAKQQKFVTPEQVKEIVDNAIADALGRRVN